MIQHVEIGGGRVNALSGGERLLTLPATPGGSYADAQIDDYSHLRRRDFPHKPPLRLWLKAQFSHPADQMFGTAGFGFWNHPFMPGTAIPRLPRYAWFFVGSPPHNMAFAKGVPGDGPKAATADFSRLPFLALAPFTPLGFLLMRVPALYRALWPLAQRAIGVAEAPLSIDINQQHTYQLDWHNKGVDFFIDGDLILAAPYTPRGPLGFVAWIDNQYAVITPQGRLGFGVQATPYTQWLRIDALEVTAL